MSPTTTSLPLADGASLLLRHWPNSDAHATMLIVHGVSEHSGRWTGVADHFVAAGYDVWAYDHRGHGGSSGDRLDIERFDDLVDDLGAVVARCRTELPLVIYAHSLGGLIATAYVTGDHAQPDLLVLSAPSLSASIPKPLVAVGRLLDRVAPRTRIPTPVHGEQLSRDPEVGERFRADPLVHLAATARFGVQVVDAMDRTRTKVDRISVPTLVIHGGEDTLVPTDASLPLAGLPGVERVVYPDLRHEMHNEPEAPEVLTDVSRWLETMLRPGEPDPGEPDPGEREH